MSALPQYGKHLHPTETMHAVVIDRYGAADQLRPATVPRPVPTRGQVLVRTRFIGVNPKDVIVRKGKFKVATGKKFPLLVGHDIAGEVVEAAPGADLAVGQQVFGMINDFAGRAYAEYAAVDAQSLCAVFKKPRENTYTVSLMRPGEQKGALLTPLPSNPVVLCGQRTLVAYPTGLDPTHLDVQRRLPNGEVTQLWLPWPRGANPDWDQGPRGFDQDEDVLIVINGDYHTQIYYLDTKEVVDLGPVYLGATVAGHYVYIDFDGFLHAFALNEQRTLHLGFRLSPDGQLLGVDVDHLAVLTCDWDGVRAVAIRPARREIVCTSTGYHPLTRRKVGLSLSRIVLRQRLEGQLRAGFGESDYLFRQFQNREL